MTFAQIRMAGVVLGLGCALGIAAPAGTHAAQGPQLVVVDGAGAVVGPVVPGPEDGGTLVTVVHAINDVPVKLLVGDNGPWDTKTRQPLFYESTDCTGTALIDVPSDPAAPRDGVIFATEVYFPEGPGDQHTIRSAAWLVRNDDECTAANVGNNLCCAALPKAQTLTAAPASATALATLRLSVPFHVEQAH